MNTIWNSILSIAKKKKKNWFEQLIMNMSKYENRGKKEKEKVKEEIKR